MTANDGRKELAARLRTLRSRIRRHRSNKTLARLATAKRPQQHHRHRREISDQMVSSWFRGDKLASDVEDLLALVRVLHDEAGPNSASFRRDEWTELYNRAAETPSRPGREDSSQPNSQVSKNDSARGYLQQPLGAPATDAQSQQLSKVQPAKGKLVDEWSPRDLRVHVAVDGARLVPYVVRSHDTAVRNAIDRAQRGQASRLIIIRGGSCTGKTRCALEALRARISQWPLIRPTGPDQLQLILKTDLDAPSVIWLDEIQLFLGGTTGDHLAQQLRETLAHKGDAIFIGTLWHETWDEFTESHDPAATSQAGRLLEVGEVIDVPATFSESEIADAKETFGTGLADVINAASESGEIIQSLAGGPLLVDMYNNADPYLSAVLTAAIDLFRIGHTAPVPAKMLREAALCYLDPRHMLRRPHDWFDRVIDRSTKPARRAVAALEYARMTADSDEMDGLALADFLGYHGKRHTSRVPHRRLWELVAMHAVDRSVTTSVALEAERRLLFDQSEALYRRTIELGRISAWTELAHLATVRAQISIADELIAVAKSDPAAAHGYPGFLWYEIALLYYAVGEPATAEEMLTNANDDLVDWSVIAKVREQHGDSVGADDAARIDCEYRGYPATWYEYLIPKRAAAGDLEGAESSAQAMAAAGFPYGWVEIGNQLLFTRHDFGGAARAFRTAAEHGHEDSWQDVGRALVELGEYEAAEQAMLRTALADVDGSQDAWAEIAALRDSLGNSEGAEAAANQAGGMGWARLATERAECDEFTTAEIAAEKAAELGDGNGWADIAGVYERRGQRAQAEAAARKAARFERGGLFGSRDGWRQIIGHRCEIEDWPAALSACLEYGHTDEKVAKSLLVAIYERSGDHETAAKLATTGNSPGNLGDLACMRERLGDSAGAEELAIQAAAVHGQTSPWRLIADIRDRHGDSTTLHQLTHFGLHPDGTLVRSETYLGKPVRSSKDASAE